MAVGASGVLGVEFGSSQLRLIHGALSGDTLRVYEFAAEEILLSNPENVPQQFALLVDQKKLRSCPVALTLSGPGVVHRVLDFPSMPIPELGAVVEREMRLVGGAGSEEIAFDWEIIEERDAGNRKEVRILVAIAPKEQVDQAQGLLGQCHLKPALFTTAPISLLRSLRFVQGEGRGLHAILYVVGQQGCLLGVKEGIWSFYREFSARTTGPGEEALFEEAVKEANRALLYHRQRYREGGEMSFLLSGESRLEELQASLQRETGMHGEVVRPGPRLDLIPLGDRAGTFRAVFPSFVVPLGLVAAAYLPAGINLVPKTARKAVSRRPNIDLSFLQRPSWALVLLLLLSGVHMVLVFTERYYQRVLSERNTLYAEWAPAIQAAEESRLLHENEKLLAQALGSTRAGETPWVVLFKAVSRLAPSDLLLTSMSAQRDGDKGAWLVTLKGEVISPDSYAAQVTFNRFYQGLKSSPHFERVELLPLNISTVTERTESQAGKGPTPAPTEIAAQSRPQGAEIKKTKVQFEVRALLKGP